MSITQRIRFHRRLAALGLFLLFPSHWIFAQTAPGKPNPEVFATPPVGEKVTRRIVPPIPQAVDFDLEQDEFLELQAQQFEQPIRLIAFNPRGERLFHFYKAQGKGTIQEIKLVASEKGRYRILIEPVIEREELKETGADFIFQVQTRRMALPPDRPLFLTWWARAINNSNPDVRPAIPLATRAAEEYRRLGDKKGEADALLQLSRAYLFSFEPEKTLQYGPRALELFRETENAGGQINILNVLGNACTDLSQYHQAMGYLKQALPLVTRPGGPRADTLRHLGNLHFQIGDDDAAIACLEEAIELEAKRDALVFLNTLYGEISAPLLRSGKLERAITILEAAKNRYITDTPEDYSTFATILLNLSRAYSQQGKKDLALSNAAKALEQAKRNAALPLEAQTLAVIAQAHADAGDFQVAANFFRESVELARSTQARSTELDALTGLAMAAFKLGKLDDSLGHITSAIEQTESIRGSLEDEQSRAMFLGSVQSRYELFYTLLMELHRRQPTAGNDAKAFLISERAKARTLIDILRTKTITTDADQAVIIKRRKVQSRINETNRTRFGLSNTPEDVKRRAELEKELAAAIEEYRDLTTQLQKLNPRFVRLTEPVALDLAEIRAQLDADSVLLEYALGTEKSYLWAVTRTGLKSYELPGRSKIEELTRQTYDALTARSREVKFEDDAKKAARIAAADRQYPTLSKELGQLLLGPVAADLTGKKVLVVGDGALLYLPFAALPLPTTGKPLVTACEVTQLPSISTLSVLRQDAAGRKPASRTVAIFADPVFEPADPRVQAEKTGPSTPATTSPVQNDVTRAAAEIDGTERDGALKRLPFTRTEAEAIGKLVPPASRRVSLDFKASRDAVFNQDLSGFRFVHFATHGLLNSTTPDLSGVVLSMVDDKGQPTDGFVHAYEVFNLKLPVEMVVLSGCRTGLGKEIRGEGMIGLTRAFLYAGAERVLVSHWAVEDSATSTLMADTYAGLLKRKLRPAAALRTAQLKMMAEPKHAHPFYWAAFTLQGEPR